MFRVLKVLLGSNNSTNRARKANYASKLEKIRDELKKKKSEKIKVLTNVNIFKKITSPVCRRYAHLALPQKSPLAKAIHVNYLIMGYILIRGTFVALLTYDYDRRSLKLLLTTRHLLQINISNH